MTNKITIYTRQGCIQCKMTKVFLNNIKQEYTEIDLDKNQAILERFKNEGFFATPIVEITGQEIFTGFHPEILTKLSNY